MGCFGGRVSLAGCTTWADLNEKCKVYDDNVQKEREILEKKKPEERTATEKDLLAFYGSFPKWDATKVDGKEFDAKIPAAADKLYLHLDSDKGSAAKTKMEEDAVALQKAISELKNKAPESVSKQ